MNELLASPEHLNDLRAGRATHTVRHQKRVYEPGQLIRIRSNIDASEWIVMRVHSVSVGKLNEFYKEHLEAANTNIEEMLSIYPLAEADSIFTIIGLERIEAAGFPVGE